MENVNTFKSEGIEFDISFYLLTFFLFFRPLTLVFAQYQLFGLNILEYFSVIFSYFLIIPVLFKIRKIPLDKINYFVILFCGYVLLSILWGSSHREIARMILPFVLFFCTRIVVTTQKHINVLVGAAIIGFIYPILGSFYSILVGTAAEKLVWSSGIAKQGGLFTRIHPFAHAIFIFSFFYSLLLRQIKINKMLIKYGLAVLFLISVFCIFKSHVRTVYLGFLIFFTLFLLNTNKKYFLLFAFGILCFATINLTQIQNIFWQTPQKQGRSFDIASSGRLTTWEHNISAFSKFSVVQKVGGIGLGGEGETVINGKIRVEPSHNDYLTLLMTLGPIGLLLYLAIYIVLLTDIYFSKLSKDKKFLFLAIVISVLVMNFVSNGYIFRVELSQFFWLLMAIFYNLNNMDYSKTQKARS